MSQHQPQQQRQQRQPQQQQQQQHGQFPSSDPFSHFTFPDRSPNSPDLIMDAFHGRTDASMLSFSQYPSLSPQGAANRVSFSDIPLSNASQIHLLQQFRSGQRDEPWNPLKATVGGPSIDFLGGRQLGGMYNTPNYQNFGGYRSVATYSEADTISPSVPKLPSDSGYGGSSTFYTDQSAETQSLIQQYTQHRLKPASVSGFPTDERPPRRRATRSHRGGSTSSNFALKCSMCEFAAKTNSELKKHLARHDKPFKCDQPNCLKGKEGFSTNNDLDRHKLCVHKIITPDHIIYRCNIQACKDKSKNWPRQDNFRQHLKRVHRLDAVDDVSCFIYRPTGVEHVGSTAMSESTPSEAGRFTTTDSHLQWAGMSQGPSGPGSSSDGTAGAARALQPANLLQYSQIQHPHMDQRDYNNPPGFQSQSQSSLDSRIELELAGLMQGRYPEEDQALSPDTSMDAQACIAPNILSHTGTGMGIFHSEEKSEMQTHPPSILLEDMSGVSQEDDFAQRHKTEPKNPISRDTMSLDEPMQYDNPDDDDESEDGEPENSTMTKMGDIKVTISPPESVQLESSNPLKDLLISSSSSSSPSSYPKSEGHSPDSIDLEDSTFEFLKAIKDTPTLDKIMSKLGYHRKFDEQETKEPHETKDIKDLSHLKDAKLDTPDSKIPGPSSVAGESVRTIKCERPNCGKMFHRPCELKKHERRHDKPYACTFAKCDRRFGSKNDWKRHENSQHSQFEIWRCLEQVVPVVTAITNTTTSSSNTVECGKVYHRRESLKTHLEREHEILDLAVIEQKLSDFKHGRNFETRFWCGFCQKTIESKKGHGGPAHMARFDHIDLHFMGKDGFEKVDISSWVGLDAELPTPIEGKGKEKEIVQAPVVMVVEDHDGGSEVGGSNNKKRGLEEQQDGSGTTTGVQAGRKSKKVKKAVGKMLEDLWGCCQCPNYWVSDNTDKCLDCGHSQCDSCDNCSKALQ